MSDSSDDILVILAGMAIRPYLAKLVGDDGSLDRRIGAILDQRPVDVAALEAIFISRQELQDWFGLFIDLLMPPEIGVLPERSAVPSAMATGDVDARVFVCPRGDYLSFDSPRAPAVATCTTHSDVHLALAGPATLVRDLTGGPSDLDATGPQVQGAFIDRLTSLVAAAADVTSGDERRSDVVELSDGAVAPEKGVAEEDSTPTAVERQINSWLVEGPDPVHHLHVQVGEPRDSNLFVAGGVSIPSGEIPAHGLFTRWVFASPLPLHALDATTQVELSTLEGTSHWTATFELMIPATGPSDERVLGIELGDDQADVDVAVLAPAGLYRRLTLRLPARTDPKQPPIEQVTDTPLISASSAALRPPHEWTTPPGEVNMVVTPTAVTIMARWYNYEITTSDTWTGAAAIGNLVDRLRLDAEAFRVVASDHLDDIDAADLDARMAASLSYVDWSYDPHDADQHHETAWAALSGTPELFTLAGTSYKLYSVLFPDGSIRRKVLDDAPLGCRVHIHWTVDTPGSIGGVPWTLLSKRPPTTGTPVDITAFLGLSYRISHTKYTPGLTSLFLGDPASAHLIDVLFWGQQAEPVSVESQRQRAWFSTKANHVVVPSVGAADPHLAVSTILDTPAPPPAACLYLYCEHDAGRAGATPRLRFGSGRSANDLLDESAFGYDPYPDGPLVFANACGTGSAGAYLTPVLEQQLFQNGCRGYIGTETKVPVTLASRVARIFFTLFEQRVDGYALTAGEALSLTRRFLWLHYRNPGGLLYGYVNQYGVLLAGESETAAVQR